MVKKEIIAKIIKALKFGFDFKNYNKGIGDRISSDKFTKLDCPEVAANRKALKPKQVKT